MPFANCKKTVAGSSLKMRAREQAAGPQRTYVPAIALTSDVKVEARMQVLKSGFDMFVPKPVNPAELLAVIHGLIPARRASQN